MHLAKYSCSGLTRRSSVGAEQDSRSGSRLAPIGRSSFGIHLDSYSDSCSGSFRKLSQPRPGQPATEQRRWPASWFLRWQKRRGKCVACEKMIPIEEKYTFGSLSCHDFPKFTGTCLQLVVRWFKLSFFCYILVGQIEYVTERWQIQGAHFVCIPPCRYTV